MNNQFFTNLESSKVLFEFSPILESPNLPLHPFSLNRKRRKKLFLLSHSLYNSTDSLIQITLSPKRNPSNFFQCHLWVHKKTGKIIDITSFCDSPLVHPFIPHIPKDTIFLKRISLRQHFITDTAYSLSFAQLSYDLTYSGRQEYPISTDAFAYYSLVTPFILPKFNWTDDWNDYRKFTAIPYDSIFWLKNVGLPLTQKQKLSLEVFLKNGSILNYQNPHINNKPFFKDQMILWSAKKGIRLKNERNNSEYQNRDRINQISEQGEFRSDKYHLESSIYFDLNKDADTLYSLSASLFDPFHSWCKLSMTPEVSTMINLYFDITEFIRREFEADLKNCPKNSIECRLQKFSFYDNKLKEWQVAFLKETQSGQQADKLIEWEKKLRNLRE